MYEKETSSILKSDEGVDVKRAEKVWKESLKLLESECPDKCCEWCEEYYPELYEEI